MIAAGVSAVIAILSALLRLLTFTGAVAAFIVGFFAFGFGGLLGASILLSFFLSSSLLSLIGKRRKAIANANYDKGSVRDAFQVLANGGVATFFIVISGLNLNRIPPRTAMFYAVAAFASANADTWATEIGGYFKKRPFLLSTFKPVDTGVSGAISIWGTVAALLGSLFVVGIGTLCWPSRSILLLWRPDTAEILAITWAGFMASFVDSLLGASVQCQYRCRTCATVTERVIHCNSNAVRVRGFTFINNDMVNFLSTASGVIFAYIMITFFGSPK